MFKSITANQVCTLVVLGCWLQLACGESGPRVYTAQAFQADPGCLDGYSPIGIVEAEALSANCDPVCLELEGQLYVSVVCAPYPSQAEVLAPGDSPDCEAALQALEDERACDDWDGGL